MDWTGTELGNNNIRQGKGKEGGEKERDGITAMLEGWVELEIIISPLIFVIYRVYSNHMKTSDSSVGTARLTLSLLRSPSKFRHYAQKPQYGLKWHKVYLSSWVINEKNKVPLFFPILTLPVKKTGGGANLAIHKKQ